MMPPGPLVGDSSGKKLSNFSARQSTGNPDVAAPQPGFGLYQGEDADAHFRKLLERVKTKPEQFSEVLDAMKDVCAQSATDNVSSPRQDKEPRIDECFEAV